MRSGQGKQIVRGALVIGGFTLIGRVLGFVQKLIMAPLFGTGMAADAYTLASGSIVFPMALFPRQLLDPFLPLFAERREREGEAAAWRLAGSVGVILAVTLIVVAGAGMILAPRLAAWASSFDSAETTALAGRLVRLMMPTLALAGLAALMALLLQSAKRFALPAAGETLNKLVVIAGLLLVSRLWGIRGLAIGVVAGAGAGLLLLAWGLRDRLGACRGGVAWRDPALRQLGWLMAPILFSSLVGWSRTVMDAYFASGMQGGSVAGLNYARGLVDSLVQLVPAAVGVAIYPFFSDQSASRDRAALRDTLMRALRVMILLFVPVSLVLIVLREPLVQLAFQRGKFTRDSVALTVGPFAFYAAGLTVVALEGLLMRFYFAVKNTVTPALVGAGCVLVHLGVILAFRESLQNGSMALASTVSKGVKVAVLTGLLAGVLPGLQGRRNALFLGKMLVAACATAGVLLLVRRAADGALPEAETLGTLMKLAILAARIAIPAAAGGAVFLAAAWLLRLEEAAALGSWIGRRLCRKRG